MERPKQISNEELIILTKKAFEEKEVVDFLQGLNGYACPLDRFTPGHVPTDFNRIIEQGVFGLYAENEDRRILRNLQEAICQLSQGEPVQVWIAYSILKSQIYYNVQHEKSPFKEIVNNLLPIIKQALYKNEKELRICKEWQGWNQENGLWDDIYRTNHNLNKHYRVNILM